MTTSIPIDPALREHFRRAPAVYDATERLHIAHEQLTDALHEYVTAIWNLLEVSHEAGRNVYLEKGWTVAQLEGLKEGFPEARQAADRAQVRWAAAVSHAEALLRDRQEGGAR
jgi:hypothetical protein